MEKFYSLRQAAVMLGIKTRTARAWVHDGKLSAIKYPGNDRWYVAGSEIERVRGEHGNKD